tara:strand:+ start:13996 stop:14298 length:303 start_codon:yes stop_codon:yes gene_type:complete
MSYYLFGTNLIYNLSISGYMKEYNPDQRYLVSYVMEHKDHKKITDIDALRDIHDSFFTRIRDLYEVNLSDEGLFIFKQIPLDSINTLLINCLPKETSKTT